MTSREICLLLLYMALLASTSVAQVASGNVAESPNPVVLPEQSQNFVGLAMEGCLLGRGSKTVLVSKEGQTLSLTGDSDFSAFVGRYVRVFGSELSSDKDLSKNARHLRPDESVFLVKRLDLLYEYCPR